MVLSNQPDTALLGLDALDPEVVFPPVDLKSDAPLGKHPSLKTLQLYLGIFESQLRLFTATGELVPTPEEAAAQAQQQAETEHQRAETEHQRAETERQRAETERQRAEQAEAQTEAERQRIDRVLVQLRAADLNPDSPT